MDFFRSILADDPEPQTLAANHQQSESNTESPKHQQTETDEGDDDDSTSNVNSSEDGTAGGGGLWSFGDLVKTLTTKSESVLETYRRDLKEFGTGLRKESDLFREVASRAVKELPSSIDAGTSAIDGVLKSTADIIAKGKEAVLKPNDADDSDASEKHINNNNNNRSGYSRFDVKLNAIRSDARTYCEDPEDLEDYDKWKLGFVVGDKRGEIERLVGENGDLVGMYEKLVPNEVQDGTFWLRYFYKVYKLELQEDMRAKLVKRSLSVDDDEEELSWDVDDDDDNVDADDAEKADQLRSNASKGRDSDVEIKTQSSKVVDEDDKNKAESVVKSEEKVDMKVESGEVKDSNVVVESNQPSSREDDDIEWDEIEDLGDNDDRKVSHGDAASKAALRTRLTAAADEEDLNWDIEDDDEEEDDKPVKAGNK